MKQQVNLYQPMFRRQKKIFSALAMLQVLVLVLLGLGAAYGYARWQLHQVGLELDRLEAQRLAAETQVEQLARRYPPPQKSRLLEDEVARLESELAESRRAAEALSGRAVGSTEGFSGHLQALARQHVEGTWLRTVAITEGGRRIGLGGSSLAPELVPQYVQRLGREAVFTGVLFNRMDLIRPEDDPLRLDFRLDTRSGDGG